MDLWLWDPLDGQGYLPSFQSNCHVGDVWHCGHYPRYGPVANQNGHYIWDHLLCESSFCYGHDMIEEDALNEKSCVQVLKILMDKADEEIVELEDDIVTLHCQLAWDDEDWSKPCSAALREKIDHLDNLIQSLKKEKTEDVHYFGVESEQPEKLPQRLHDLVKPLLENYFLVKSKQTESTSNHNKKVEEKECINLLKKERNSLSMEIEERIINNRQQKKAGSREKDERRNTDKEVISKAKVIRRGLQHQSKVINSDLESKAAETVKPADAILDSGLDCVKQITEASIKMQKARTHKHGINQHILSAKPLVKIKRKRTKSSETTEILEAQLTEMKVTHSDSLLVGLNQKTKHASKPIMKLEPKNQAQEIRGLAKSVSSLKPEGQGPEKKCMAASETGQNLCLAAESDMQSSPIEILKEQQEFGVPEKIGKNGKKETQQELSGTRIDGASEVTITSISSPQKKRELSFSLQTIREKKGPRNLLMKLANVDYDTSNGTVEEVTDDCGVEDMPWNSSSSIKDVDRLSLNHLKILAKNRNLPGNHKLQQEELQKHLGLEP